MVVFVSEEHYVADLLVSRVTQETREASSRQERALVVEPSTETAAGDSLALSMRGKGNVGRPEEFQAGAAEIQVTEETV